MCLVDNDAFEEALLVLLDPSLRQTLPGGNDADGQRNSYEPHLHICRHIFRFFVALLFVHFVNITKPLAEFPLDLTDD